MKTGVQGRGRSPRQGNSRGLLDSRSLRSTPARRPGQPQTDIRNCWLKPAHQSLITDVFQLRPHPCTTCPTPRTLLRSFNLLPQRLTKDIRAIQRARQRATKTAERAAAAALLCSRAARAAGLLRFARNDGAAALSRIQFSNSPRLRSPAFALRASADKSSYAGHAPVSGRTSSPRVHSGPRACRSSFAFLGHKGRAERLGVSPHPRPRVQVGGRR